MFYSSAAFIYVLLGFLIGMVVSSIYDSALEEQYPHLRPEDRDKVFCTPTWRCFGFSAMLAVGLLFISLCAAVVLVVKKDKLSTYRFRPELMVQGRASPSGQGQVSVGARGAEIASDTMLSEMRSRSASSDTGGRSPMTDCDEGVSISLNSDELKA